MNDDPPTLDPREQEVFSAALGRADPMERNAFLDTECAGNPRLREWIDEEIRVRSASSNSHEETLAMSGDSDSGSTQRGQVVETLFAALKTETPEDNVGAYKLLERLGEGSFGIVWMAEQEKPVRRRVALKILKPGMDTKRIIARFEMERQALAVMDHPGIAKVFDAGATPTGRPYFVMELVRGVPITEYCDTVRLSADQRVELLMRVCYAVQHAHQKGIIHRDLKPSNILVALDDHGTPVPKVIDLGLAKAAQQQVTDHTLLFTQAEQMLGTPLYMSPEQAEGGGLDVDTRTDIYALGVVLYQLLIGRTPFEPRELMRRSPDEIRRAIRENDPPRPSVALRTMPVEMRSEVAQRRRSEPPQLIRTIRGDLDWICMKAMEKDRRRRYSAAAGLAADIQHYLLHEPVTARPPSQWYRLQKGVQRNRAAFVVSALVAAIILAGGIIGFAEALRATRAEQRAVAAQARESRLREQADMLGSRAARERSSAGIAEYVADLGLARQSLEAGNFGNAVRLLEKHRPKAGEADLRGFDWRTLWQLCQGDEHIAFPEHGGPAMAVAFSPSGDTLAIGGLETVTICDVQTHSLLAVLSPGADSLDFLPDGETLIATGRGNVNLWHTALWTEAGSWQEGDGPSALSRDGRHFAIVCPDGVRIRGTQTWQEERLLPGATGPLAFSPDGTMLATNGPSGLTLWALPGGEPRLLAQSAGLFSRSGDPSVRLTQGLLFSADGASLVARNNGLSEHGAFTLAVWDVRTGREIAALPDDPGHPEHTGVITALALSPDGKVLATASTDQSVRLWDLARRVRTATLRGHQAEVRSVAFSPDGRSLATGDRLGRVNTWDLAAPKGDDAIVGVVHPLGFSKDGRTLAALTQKNAVVFFNPSTREPVQTFKLESLPPGTEPVVAVNADLRTLAQGLEDGRVKLWDTGTGEPRTLQVSNLPVNVVALALDGRILITGSRGQRLRSHDLQTNAESVLPFESRHVFVSPDGKVLAAIPEVTASPPDADFEARPKSVFLWNLATGARQATLEMNVEGMLGGAFSPDGRLFATAGMDESIRIWDAGTGVLLGICLGHKEPVRDVAFSFDGKTLGSVSDDSTLRLWNIATQQQVLAIQDLGAGMTRLLFSPDNRTLAVARAPRSPERSLRFYRAPLLEETEGESVPRTGTRAPE